MIIDFFSILPLTCSMFVFLLGLFVLSKSYSSLMNKLFFSFCVCMVFWLFGTFMMFALRNNPVAALFWDRFVYMGVVFMPPLMQHFSLLFSGRIGEQKKILWLNYLVALFFLFATQTPWFVDDVYQYSWGVHSQARLLHHIFLLYFFVGTGIFFKNLLGFYKKTEDKQTRLQTIYVFISFASVIFIGGFAYLYAYGIDTRFPFSYISGMLFPVLLFYAVTKHHLLNSRTVFTEALVGLTIFFVVMQIFLSNTLYDVLIRAFFAVAVSFIGYLLIRSVNDEVRRREELGKLAASLEQANLRLQELDRQKTDFLSIAAHQLRTPLSIINGYIELIKDGDYGKVGKKVQEILHNMDESNGHLIKLVDEFLNITRIEQGRTKYDFKESDMVFLVSDVVRELNERALQKGLKIEWAPSKTKKNIVMDSEKIRHVVFNFIDNAIKYSNEGAVTVHVAEENNGLTVRVKDHGFGFEKVDEANFFQKFYRGENVKGTNVNGTGLGLYVCRMFVEAHKGKVWAHSPGLKKGSEFGLWLPREKKVAVEYK